MVNKSYLFSWWEYEDGLWSFKGKTIRLEKKIEKMTDEDILLQIILPTGVFLIEGVSVEEKDRGLIL